MSEKFETVAHTRRREAIAWVSYVWVVGSALFLWTTLAANQLLTLSRSLGA